MPCEQHTCLKSGLAPGQTACLLSKDCLAEGVDIVSIGKVALDMLKETSRTFFIPISRLPAGLQDAVMSGYLCLRAIDEVEDHPRLDNRTKAILLHSISYTLQTTFAAGDFTTALGRYQQELPEVTLRIGDWAFLAPPSIAPRVWEATATMADRMAQWAENGSTIQTEAGRDPHPSWGARPDGLRHRRPSARRTATHTNP